jgi:ABC-type Fe3+-hydroxamate transport system substrate-binding protein
MTGVRLGIDDLGTPVEIPPEVRRVVSLVPSLTEALAVSAPELVVGATDWCSHPSNLAVTRVRGTKNPDVPAVIALRPDLVVANEEENRLVDLDALRAAGLPVWVTAPRTVPAGLASLGRMLSVCGVADPGWLAEAEAAWASVHPRVRRTAVVPIWRRPWMVVGRDTFTGDVLKRLGVDNLWADAAERYPKVTLAALVAARPELVVLPDEPYAFSAADGPEAFPGIPAALVSGRHLTWYGPSLAQAPAVLSAQLDAAT